MFLRTIFFIILTTLLAACSSDSEPVVGTPAKRTVLVYMVAANSLGNSLVSGGTTYEDASEADVTEMLTGAKNIPSDCRLLLYRDRYEGSPMLYQVAPGGLKALKEYSRDFSSLDSERIKQVLDDSRAQVPAENFGLVLWSHADGWLQNGNTRQSSPLRSWGQDRSRRLNVTDLAQILAGQNLEFIYFDCCLMGSVEVMYELRHCAPYVVASTSELPRPGMPYHLCLPSIMSGTPQGLIESAKTTFEYYAAYPEQQFRTCSISVIATAALDDLARLTARLYAGAPLAHQGSDITNYNGRTRSGYYIDFGEYVTSLAGRGSDADPGLTDAFSEKLSQVVLYRAATPMMWAQFPVYTSSGLSTNVFNTPDRFTAHGYDELQWAQDVVAPSLTTRTF